MKLLSSEARNQATATEVFADGVWRRSYSVCEAAPIGSPLEIVKEQWRSLLIYFLKDPTS